MSKLRYDISSSTKLLLDFTDTVSPLTDKSGNGNNATNNGATLVNTGRFGNAYSFDGVNDYMTVAITQASLNASFTMHVISKPTTPEGSSHQMVAGFRNSAYQCSISLHANLYYMLYCGDSTYTYINTPIKLSQYSLVTMVVNATTISFYVDGYYRGQGYYYTQLQGSLLYIGWDIWDVNRVFKGNMDFIQIDNRAWSPKEIHDFYQRNFRQY